MDATCRASLRGEASIAAKALANDAGKANPADAAIVRAGFEAGKQGRIDSPDRPPVWIKSALLTAKPWGS